MISPELMVSIYNRAVETMVFRVKSPREIRALECDVLLSVTLIFEVFYLIVCVLYYGGRIFHVTITINRF